MLILENRTYYSCYLQSKGKSTMNISYYAFYFRKTLFMGKKNLLKGTLPFEKKNKMINIT